MRPRRDHLHLSRAPKKKKTTNSSVKTISYRRTSKLQVTGMSSTSTAPLQIPHSTIKLPPNSISKRKILGVKSVDKGGERYFFYDVVVKAKCVGGVGQLGKVESEKSDFSTLQKLFALFRSHISREPFVIRFPSKEYENFDRVICRMKSLPKYVHSVIEFQSSPSPIPCPSPRVNFFDMSEITFTAARGLKEVKVLMGCFTFTRIGQVHFSGLNIQPISTEENPFILIIRESGCVVKNCRIRGEIEIRECFDVKQCVIFRDNEIYDSPSVGLYVESSYVDISHNQIHSHKANGINIGSSEGFIMNNSIYNNGDPGIYFKDGTDCIVQNNKIFENLSNGINVANDSSSIFIGNEIWGNEHPGFYVKENSNPKVVDNIFRDSNSNAINIDGARGTYEHNLFYSNSAPVFFVKNGANPIFRNNKILRNPTNAIVLENSFGKFYNNEISEIRTECPAIYIDHSHVEFVGNVLQKNEGIGFYLTNRSIGVFQKNLVTDHESSAFSVEGKSEPVIIENKIKRISGNALLMEKSSGRFEKNEIRDVKDYPCIMMTYCRSIMISENDFKGGCGDICICCNFSSGSIERNKFGEGIKEANRYAIDESSTITKID